VAPAVETTTGEQGQQQPFGPLFSPTKKNGGIKAAWANDEDDTTTKMTMADNTEKKLSIGGGGGTSGAEARRPSSASLTGRLHLCFPQNITIIKEVK
jgi:hypothetical protein